MNEVSLRDERRATDERNLVGWVPTIWGIGWLAAGVDRSLVMEALGPVCIFCGDAVGNDDRLIVIEHDGERETSFAREPWLRDQVRALLVHARCAPTAHCRNN
jgi:hypothetical protein